MLQLSKEYNMSRSAVVLVSGGMDSALCCSIAKQDGFEICGLHLNYGQRTQERELQAFWDLSKHYNFKNELIVDISYLVQIGGSSLTDKTMEVSEADLNSKEIPSSYVPFRNANILAIGVSWAESIGAQAIYIGAMQLDSSGYPDCREEFFAAFQMSINTGTKPDTMISIKIPLINLSKKDIIETGKKLKVPFELTWSCYQNSDIACGICDSCALRLRGFQETGIDDPIDYISRPKYD
jgi:7-cyano-7-deazaguanine synthase